jgi:signal transduction histidine kinase
LARADSGRSLAKEPVEVSSILDETILQARQLDQERSIPLDTSSNLDVIGDRDALKQLLLIVLDYALKHSNGAIDVSSLQKGSQVEIRVQDFGEGISSEKLEHVFDRFYRGDDAVTIPGFGLGLSIAKTLVNGMGGEITMESELGKGSTVIMQFREAS